jgi:DNA-binding transcriptional MocR family regulator
VSADELIITVGASEAISLVLRVLAQPGDAVVVESPCYFGYLLLLEAFGLKALEVPTSAELGPDLEALKKAVARPDVKAAILQPNFGNPLGGVYPLESRGEIYRTITDAGIPLIEDDLYGDLYFGERRPPSFLAEDVDDSGRDRGMVIHVGAFSKTLAPGYRVGWVRPGRWFEEVLKMKAATTLMTARPTQLVLAQFLAEGRYKRHMRSFKAKCRNQLSTFSAHIHRTFPEGTRISNPKGGFVLWVELPDTVDALELFNAAYKRGIGLAPGDMYSSQDRFKHFLRINCGYPWSERIQKAVETVGELACGMAGQGSLEY